jgi:glycosyltransferase involved in cell wall biosynthesis
MKPTAISVIIPTYNRARLLPRAIDSVLPQLEDGDELIVVDDGSTDDTSEVVAGYGDKIVYIRTRNGGCGAARNCGVKMATRPLVAFLDSDDEWMPDHNLVLRSVMEARPELVFCFTNFASRFRDGKTRRFALESQYERMPDWEEIVGPARKLSSFMVLPKGVEDYLCHETDNLYRSLCGTSYISADTLIVRREAAGESLWFADDTKVAEELECGARLAATGKGLYIHYESTLVHHHTGEQLVNNTGLDMATSRIVVMERIWGKDHNFLRHHRPYYEQRLRADRIIRVGAFLVQGRTKEARQEIANTHEVPHSYRLLAQLPGSVTKGLLSIRRVIKSKLQGVAAVGLLLPFDVIWDTPNHFLTSDALAGIVQIPGILQLIGV